MEAGAPDATTGAGLHSRGLNDTTLRMSGGGYPGSALLALSHPWRTSGISGALLLLAIAPIALLLREGGSAAPPRTPATGPATLFVSPSGSDGAACTRADPCASWNRAYQRSRPGTVVEVGGGTYGSQTITSRASMRDLEPGCATESTSNCVVFRPARGATVTIAGSLEVRGSSVWVQGTASPTGGVPSASRTYNIRITGYVDTEADSTSSYPDHVIFEGIHSTSFGAFGVDTATFRNMDVGPATVTSQGSGCYVKEGEGFENKIGFGRGILVVPRNVVLDGLRIHNQNGDEGRIAGGCHWGGLFVVTVDGLVIRNSVFSQNVVYNIQAQNFNADTTPPPTNVTIENNWFGCPVNWIYQSDTTCDGQSDLQFNAASQFANWLIRFNSFAGGVGQYVPGASYANVRLIGNIGPPPSDCWPGVTFAFNLWVGRGCGPTDAHLRRLPYRSAAVGQEDFRLLPASRASGYVPAATPGSALRLDLEGRVRPVRFPRAAGAIERDTAVLVLGRSIGSASLGMARQALLDRYGAPRSSRPLRIGDAKTSARVDGFAVPGGLLRATTVGDLVVGLSTTSPFYTTKSGLGVGSSLADVETLVPGRRDPCTGAYRRQAGPVAISFVVRRGRKDVQAISMLLRSYERTCAGAR